MSRNSAPMRKSSSPDSGREGKKAELPRLTCRLIPWRFWPPLDVYKRQDIGSGTGILSRAMLEHGWTVYGVEPNDDMRREAEKVLKGFHRFHSVRCV